MLIHWYNRFSEPDAQDFNFDFSLTHYIIYPWIVEDTTLVRVHRIPTISSPIVSRISKTKGGFIVYNICKKHPSKNERRLVKEQIRFCLGLDASMRKLQRAARKDPVIIMAMNINKGIRPKRYTDIFEAVCGAICAQNVNFRRLYTMMELLSKKFGRNIMINHSCYWAFPQAKEIAKASVSDLKECKVGYRAERILNAARWFANNKKNTLTANQLREMDKASAIETICGIPGIGPYSAAIVLSAGAGRQDIFHIDSFTRLILQEMYFGGKEASDETYLSFAEDRWGKFCGLAAHLLTTNTEIWADKLGRHNFRPSGARNL